MESANENLRVCDACNTTHESRELRLCGSRILCTRCRAPAPAPAPSFTVSDQTLYSIVVLIAVLLFCYIATGDPLAAFNQSYTGGHNSP